MLDPRQRRLGTVLRDVGISFKKEELPLQEVYLLNDPAKLGYLFCWKNGPYSFNAREDLLALKESSLEEISNSSLSESYRQLISPVEHFLRECTNITLAAKVAFLHKHRGKEDVYRRICVENDITEAELDETLDLLRKYTVV